MPKTQTPARQIMTLTLGQAGSFLPVSPTQILPQGQQPMVNQPASQQIINPTMSQVISPATSQQVINPANGTSQQVINPPVSQNGTEQQASAQPIVSQESLGTNVITTLDGKPVSASVVSAEGKNLCLKFVLEKMHKIMY